MFTAGGGPATPVDGTPTVAITASAANEAGRMAFTLALGLVDDPEGAIYQVRRDGASVRTGIGDLEFQEGVEGHDRQQVCYTLTQFRGDESELGTSEPACGVVAGLGCASSSTAPSQELVVLGLGALLVRRRLQWASDPVAP